MRRLTLLLLALLAAVPAATSAQAVSGNTVQDGFGNAALLSLGSACFSQSPFISQTCFAISNGHFSGSVTAATYRFQVQDPSSNVILTLNSVVVPVGSWSFDTYVIPVLTPQAPAASGNGPPYLVGGYNQSTAVGAQYLQLDPHPGFSAFWTAGSPGQEKQWYNAPTNPSNQTEAGNRPVTYNQLDAAIQAICLVGGCFPPGVTADGKTPAGLGIAGNLAVGASVLEGDGISPINVMALGAKCDGVTNDTAAFAAAMARVPIAGGTVYVPAKTCVAHVVLPTSTTLIGYGAVLRSPDGASATITAGNLTTILGVNLYGFGSGAGDIGIYDPISAQRLVVRDVFAQNYGEEGLNIQAVAVKVDNFLAYNTAMSHVADVSGKHCAVLINSTDDTIENSEVGTSVQTFGFNSNLVRGALCVTGSNNFIGPNNQFETSDFGVYDFGFWNKYIGNRADLNGGPGFIAAGVGSYYIGNHSHNNSLAATGTYDDFIATGTNNNNFLGNMAANTNHLCLTGGTPCYTRYAYNNDTGFQNNWSQDKTQWPGGTTTALWNGGTGISSTFSVGAGTSSGFLNTTAATTDTVAVTGVSAIGICTISPTNSSAATNIATTYISSKTANQITVTHVATAGMLYNILCMTNTTN